jgi:transposase InsO family protein
MKSGWSAHSIWLWLVVVLMASREEARWAIFTYLEVYYNRIRRHSTRGYVSPFVYEQGIMQQMKQIF